MLFTSYGFIFFLCVVIGLYYIIPKQFQWKLLLVSSFVFYYFSGWSNLIYISVTIVSTYFVGLKLDSLDRQQNLYLKENKEVLSREDKKAYKEKIKARRWRWLLLCLFFNLGILAVIKYTNFVIANINSIFTLFKLNELSFVNLLLPMGISFYTFQTMGYIIDVYRGKYGAEKNIGKLALFVSFFPQLIQGPISRYDDLSLSLYKEHNFDPKGFSFGFQRVLWGYFKKLVIADRIVIAVLEITKNPETYDGIFVLVGMVFYAIQLYADFTGGIDITIGIAQMLGIKVKENFNRPYFSKSIVEYWRRWHITMGTWFKDYIFYPLSVCKPMLNISKSSRKRFGEQIGKRVPVYLSTITVWFTTGIWHGSSWNFIVWGLLNGFVILVSQEFEPLYAKFHQKFNVRNTFGFRLFQVIRTFLLMSSLRILDCYRDVGISFRMFGSMFTKLNINELFTGSLLKLGLDISDYVVLLIGVIILISLSLVQRSGSVREKISGKPVIIRYTVFVLLFFSIIIFGAYGIGFDSNQFIYNQF
ncbi:MAG: MBOAT family protein [Clostridiaceae bacterium]|jgi:alginate O-acetyltransferase complex protein AlgI|nr:MBOAT family protein [Clostridiaceae bacterium]